MSSQEYFEVNPNYEQLRELRSEALVQSNQDSVRRNLGRLSFEEVNALWQPGVEGSVTLREIDLGYGSTRLPKFRPTTLSIYEPINNGTLLTEFRMDLDNNETIGVHKTIYTHHQYSYRDSVKYIYSKLKERKLKFDSLTGSDLAVLYTQLERGASGQYYPPWGRNWQ